ncbi:hypothetical protein GTV32_19080 [Gordonia sp. SID5947]|uniref:hypothetical protein n=1 Tax=Gordonia sp. SID5947 TaxID=2690315 RepID=UPI00136D410F|nr:hypothetical protein [Gordonia sp. SID5947]MYR08271.1 hypothetical protein [Gordonia sp. SID5947]
MQEESSILASLGIDPATSPEPPAGVWEAALAGAFDPDAVADPATVPDMDDTPPADDDDVVIVDDPHVDHHDAAHHETTDSATGHVVEPDLDDTAADDGAGHHDVADQPDLGSIEHDDHGHDGHHDI